MCWAAYTIIEAVIVGIGASVGVIFASFVLMKFLSNWSLEFSEKMRQEEKRRDKE